MIKKALKFLASFVAFYALAITSAVMYETQFMYNYKGSSVVMLRSTRSGGTGFKVYAPSGATYIMTNKHVCGDSEYLEASYGDQTAVIGVLEVYDEHDLCLLETIEEIPALSLSADLSEHERVWLIGHPALRQLTLESGHFVGNTDIQLLDKCSKEDIEEQLKELEKSEDPEDIIKIFYLYLGMCVKTVNANHINNISYGGNSGSPVLDKWGDVVGVLFAGMRGQPTASYIVPLEHLHKFLKGK